MASKQERFEQLQAKWRESGRAVSDYLFRLRSYYGETYRAKASERAKLDKLRAREDKACEAFYSWLDQNSPRDWRHGCPISFVMDDLTFADAVTSGPLSVIPPCCYGAMPEQMRWFARALAGEFVS